MKTTITLKLFPLVALTAVSGVIVAQPAEALQLNSPGAGMGRPPQMAPALHVRRRPCRKQMHLRRALSSPLTPQRRHAPWNGQKRSRRSPSQRTRSLRNCRPRRSTPRHPWPLSNRMLISRSMRLRPLRLRPRRKRRWQPLGERLKRRPRTKAVAVPTVQATPPSEVLRPAPLRRPMDRLLFRLRPGKARHLSRRLGLRPSVEMEISIRFRPRRRS